MFLKSERNSETDEQPDSAPAASFIGADMTVGGELRGAGAVCIDGAVAGDVVGRSVTVGERGRVEGSVFAEFAHIAGTVKGRVEAVSVSVAKSADIGGTITHNEIEIEPGTKIEGRRPWRPLSYLEQNRKW